MQTYSEHFVARVEGFLASSRMKPTDFGREAVGDPSFIIHLRRGRSPSLATADRILAFVNRLEAVTASKNAQRTMP